MTQTQTSRRFRFRQRTERRHHSTVSDRQRFVDAMFQDAMSEQSAARHHHRRVNTVESAERVNRAEAAVAAAERVVENHTVFTRG